MNSNHRTDSPVREQWIKKTRYSFGARLYAYTPASVMTHPAAPKLLTELPKMSSEMAIEITTFTLPTTEQRAPVLERVHAGEERRYTRAQIFKWRLGGVQLKNKVLHPIRGRDPQRPGPSGDAHRLPRPGSGHLHISRHRAP